MIFNGMTMRKCNSANKTGARFDLWAAKAALLFHNRPDIQSGKGRFTNTKIHKYADTNTQIQINKYTNTGGKSVTKVWQV